MSSTQAPPLPPHLNHELATFLSTLQLPKITDTPAMTEALRVTALSLAQTPELLAKRNISAHDISIPSFQPNGPPNTIAVLNRSSSPIDPSRPKPCFMFCHGSALHWANRYCTLYFPLHLIEALDCTVLSVEYRKAPEDIYPASVEDVYSALVYACNAENAKTLGIDPTSIILCGISGGGPPAMGAALLARDRKAPVNLAGILLGYPMLDNRSESLSMRQFPDDTWIAPANRTAWISWLGGEQREKELESWEGGFPIYAAPGRASVEQIKGLPPMYLEAGSAETLRDETVDFARKIWEAGGRAEFHVWEGGFHGFEVFMPQSRLAVSSWRAKEEWVREIWGMKKGEEKGPSDEQVYHPNN